jgi:hypothetical protein
MYVKLDANNRVAVAVGILPDGEQSSDWISCDDSLMGAGRLISDNGVIRVATQAEVDQELTQLRTNAAGNAARFKRDRLLTEADKFTQLDRWENFTTAQKTAITTYKQALRDITNQSGFPLDIAWPVEPTL